MDDIAKAVKMPQKQRISESLTKLRNVKLRANQLMERLHNGVEDDRGKVPVQPEENSTVFMSLWESLPESMDDIRDGIEAVLSELENKLLN